MLHDQFNFNLLEELNKKEKIFQETLELDLNDLHICDCIIRYIIRFLSNDLTKQQLNYLKMSRISQNNSINLELDQKYFNKFNIINNEYTFKLGMNDLGVFNIIITKNNKYRNVLLGYEDTTKTIILPIIKDHFDLNTIKIIVDNKINIIHELTHYITDIKTHGEIFKKNQVNTNDEIYNHYNSEDEIYAYSIQLLAWLRRYISYNKQEFINKLDKYGLDYFNYNTISKLINNSLLNDDIFSLYNQPYEFDKKVLQRFLQVVNPEDKTIVINEVVKFIQKLIQKYKNKYSKTETLESITFIEYLLDNLPL